MSDLNEYHSISNALKALETELSALKEKLTEEFAPNIELESTHKPDAHSEELEELLAKGSKEAAKYPWRDPDVQESLKTIGVTFKMSAVTHAKVKWYVKQVPGGISIQKLLEGVVNDWIDAYVANREREEA